MSHLNAKLIEVAGELLAAREAAHNAINRNDGVAIRIATRRVQVLKERQQMLWDAAEKHRKARELAGKEKSLGARAAILLGAAR